MGQHAPVRLRRTVLPLAVLAAFALAFGGHEAGVVDLDRRLLAPFATLAHPLGTDHLGRDLLARLAAGGWATAEAVLAGAAMAATAGLLLGLSGALMSPIGAVARGAGQLLASIPGLLVALAVAGAAGGAIAPALAGVALAVPAGGQAALVVAGLARTAAAEGHVRAAMALGVALAGVLARHLWPVIRDAWLAWAGARLPRIALGYAGLAFLGLGADAGRPDWGAMVWEYRTHALASPWLPAVPVLGLAWLALGLRAAFGTAGAEPDHLTAR